MRGGTRGVILSILTDEGVLAFYKGIQAAALRECAYTSLRLGLYDHMKGITGADQIDSGMIPKFMAGALSGSFASLSGNPFEVIKTRMMAC